MLSCRSRAAAVVRRDCGVDLMMEVCDEVCDGAG